LRLELERLLPPLPFEDERPFAVVRPRPPLEELRPFDELLVRPDELLPRLDELPLRLDDDEPLRELAELLLRFDAELRLPDELLRRDEDRPPELDDERCFLTSPSSIRPRQDPVYSSSIIT
jgi:hypothetical protein